MVYIYLSLCTRLISCKSWEMFVWSPKEQHFWLVITQVSSGLNKLHIFSFSNYKYLPLKIASLATVKSCHFTSNSLMANVWPCVVSVDYRLSCLTKDTSMITVSSCGVKFQEVLSGCGKRLTHWTYSSLLWLFSTFIQLFFISYHLGVILLFSQFLKLYDMF